LRNFKFAIFLEEFFLGIFFGDYFWEFFLLSALESRKVMKMMGLSVLGMTKLAASRPLAREGRVKALRRERMIIVLQ